MGIKRRISRKNARAKFIEDIKFTVVLGLCMILMFVIPFFYYLIFGYVL